MEKREPSERKTHWQIPNYTREQLEGMNAGDSKESLEARLSLLINQEKEVEAEMEELKEVQAQLNLQQEVIEAEITKKTEQEVK